MIPAPPEIPRPVPRGPNPAVPPSRAPRSLVPRSLVPRSPCPAVRAPKSRAHPGSASPQPSRHKLAPRLTTQTSPTLPPRHKRFRPTTPPRSRSASSHPPPVPARAASGSRPLPAPLGGAPFHPRLTTRTLRHASSPARACAFPPAPADASLPELCTSAVACRRLHLCVTLGAMLTSAPSHHNPMGYLSLEQFHECDALPNRFSRAPHSWKVSSRGGVAAGVSGGREDGAAGGTGQGSRLVPVGGPDWSSRGVARHRAEYAAGWAGRRL